MLLIFNKLLHYLILKTTTVKANSAGIAAMFGIKAIAGTQACTTVRRGLASIYYL